jgi:hypothetical protein
MALLCFNCGFAFAIIPRSVSAFLQRFGHSFHLSLIVPNGDVQLAHPIQRKNAMAAKPRKASVSTVPNKKYLCRENGEEFTVEANSMEQAREFAGLYGGSVVREMEAGE